MGLVLGPLTLQTKAQSQSGFVFFGFENDVDGRRGQKINWCDRVDTNHRPPMSSNCLTCKPLIRLFILSARLMFPDKL